jgi:hypothetical protein
MAERRMFAKTIVTSDAFLDMPATTRCLYFLMAMLADDDGFVNSPKSIMRQAGASEDDLKILLAKRYILGFESGVIVIKHWKIHNLIQKDRYKETTYLEEKSQLVLDAKKSYTEAYSKVETPCIQPVSKVETQVSIGKDRLVKESIGKGRSVEGSEEDDTDPADNQLFRMDGKLGKGVVFLSIAQMEDLLDRIGFDAFNLYVERLADYIIEKDAKIKNHYETILKWHMEDTQVAGDKKC